MSTALSDRDARYAASGVLYAASMDARDHRDASARMCAYFLLMGCDDIARGLAVQTLKRQATVRECSVTAGELVGL
jgi:hypothetical protein